jgi:hypothetical protein
MPSERGPIVILTNPPTKKCHDQRNLTDWRRFNDYRQSGTAFAGNRYPHPHRARLNLRRLGPRGTFSCV